MAILLSLLFSWYSVKIYSVIKVLAITSLIWYVGNVREKRITSHLVSSANQSALQAVRCGFNFYKIETGDRKGILGKNV